MVDMNLLTIQERIFVWSLKANFYSLCYFLVRIKSAEFRKKNKLKYLYVQLKHIFFYWNNQCLKINP